MENQDIAGQGSCLLMEAFGLAGINCFYEKLGYICESPGNCLSLYFSINTKNNKFINLLFPKGITF